jgi:hypothetical protein
MQGKDRKQKGTERERKSPRLEEQDARGASLKYPQLSCVGGLSTDGGPGEEGEK